MVQNSNSPNDEQMRFISKSSNTLDFSLSGSISCFSLSIFRELISALKGNAINLTGTNFAEFHRLCEEFGFMEIAAKLSGSRLLMNFIEGESEAEADDADARGCTQTNCSA
jgi:hypothetical protein